MLQEICGCMTYFSILTKQQKFLAMLFVFIATPLIQFGVLSADAAGKPAPKVLEGNVQQNEMIDNLERLGIKCLVQEGVDRKLVVRDVRMGSNAFYKGMSVGDVVKSLAKTGDLYQLTFERDGKTYMLPLKPLVASTDSNALSGSAKQTELSGNAAENQADLKAGKARLAALNTPIVDVAPRSVPIIDVNQKNPPIVDVDPKKKGRRETCSLRYRADTRYYRLYGLGRWHWLAD